MSKKLWFFILTVGILIATVYVWGAIVQLEAGR